MMTLQASKYIRAETYEEGMESVFHLEENAHDTQNTSQPTTRRCAQSESLTYKSMQPTGHCFITYTLPMCKDKKLIWKSKKKKSKSCKNIRRNEQEEKPVFYSSIPLDKHNRDRNSHASRYEVIPNVQT